MLPAIPILRRQPLHSGLSNALYNPHTMITRILPENSCGLEETEHFRDVFEYHATVVHERVHWLQHHGTSLGCFLSALRYSQQGTAIRWLSELPPDEISRMLRARADGGVPIMSIATDRNYPVFNDNDSQQLNTLRQIWFDHQWIHAAFDDSRTIEQTGTPPGSAIGEVISDVVESLALESKLAGDIHATMKAAPLEARKWYAVDDDSMALVAINGKRLTSKLLMEAAATIAELRLLPIQIWKDVLGTSHDDAICSRLRRIFDGDYGVPIRSLLEILNADLLMLPKVLPTVSAICYAALNPPLPPYVMGPPPGRKSWEWRELYPPARFAHLAHKVKSVGLLEDCNDHDAICQFLADLCDAAELPSVVDMSFPVRDPAGWSLNFSDVNQKYSVSTPASYNEYVIWTQTQLGEMRKNSLPFLVSFGDCMAGDLLMRYQKDILVLSDNEVPFTRCPLHWGESDKIGFSCHYEFGNWLVGSVAAHYVLFDVIAGVGEFDLAAFPPELKGNKQFRELLDSTIWRWLTNRG